jgi:hypothetical protein
LCGIPVDDWAALFSGTLLEQWNRVLASAIHCATLGSVNQQQQCLPKFTLLLVDRSEQTMQVYKEQFKMNMQGNARWASSLKPNTIHSFQKDEDLEVHIAQLAQPPLFTSVLVHFKGRNGSGVKQSMSSSQNTLISHKCMPTL